MQPPLTRASRQLRSESLPLFYGTCCFPLQITVPDSLNVMVSLDEDAQPRIPESGAQAFFDNTNSQHLARIRKWDLTIHDSNGFSGCCKFFANIQLSADGRSFAVDLKNIPAEDRDFKCHEAIRVAIKRELETYMVEVANRGLSDKWRSEDLHRIRCCLFEGVFVGESDFCRNYIDI